MSSREREKHMTLQADIIDTHALLPQQSYKFGDMMIDEKEHIHYFELDASPNTPKPKILMVHGYGGNNIIFYRMYRHLSAHFNVVSIDLPGMGFNYRVLDGPAFKTLEQCVEFMVTRIAKFVDAKGWDKFSLIGHSMGGFFSAHFFDRFPDRVEKLVLLSPAGFNETFKKGRAGLEDSLQRVSWWKKLLFKTHGYKICEQKMSLFEISSALIRNFGIKQYMSSRRFNFARAEQEKMIALNQYILGLPQCGERCIGYVFDWGLQTEMPIVSILGRHRGRLGDVAVLYGEFDWMDWSLSLSKARELGLAVNFFQVEKCDHQLIIQNPEKTSELILNWFLNNAELVEKHRMVEPAEAKKGPSRGGVWIPFKMS